MKHLFIAIVCAVVVSAGALAAEAVEVTPEEFRRHASMPRGTMVHSDYLGVTQGKAHVVVRRMSMRDPKLWSEQRYWVAADRMEPGYLESLKKRVP